MKNLKKIIAIVLVCIMAFSALQVSASASALDTGLLDFATSALQEATPEFSTSTLLVGILYAFFPILIVIDLVSMLVTGNALIGGGLTGMIK